MDAVTFQTEAMCCERLMYHVGYSILHNDQDCADAVQEALTRAWQKQHTLRNPSRFRPWLMKILVNACRDILRQRQKIRFVPLEEQMLPAEPPAEPLPLRECIDQLRPEWRITVLLYYLEGFSVAEIADTLGVPQGRQVGEVLHKLLQCVLEGRLPNERQALLAYAKGLVP